MTGVAASLINRAVEAFVVAAAAVLPGAEDQFRESDRLGGGNVLPLVVPRFLRVPAAAVGQAFVKAVKGVQTGQVLTLDAS